MTNASYRISDAWFLRILATLSLFLVAVASCSEAPSSPKPAPAQPIPVLPAPTEAVIGPEGGNLIHASGARLTVPPGALAFPVRLTLEGGPPPEASVLGAVPLAQALHAGPEGQQFLKPVELVLPFDPARLPPGADVTSVQVKMAPRGSTAFVAVDSQVDPTARAIRISTVHFTQFVPVQSPNPVSITTPGGLPDATTGAQFSQQLAASDGTPPYVWSVSAGSVLPPGLTLEGSGLLEGAPAVPSSFGFFITASDAAGHSVQKAFALLVLPTNHPVPVLTQVAPTSAAQYSAATSITLTGADFVPTSGARWDGVSLATTFVNTGTLTAVVPASALTAAGTHAITVVSPAPGGGTSASVAFAVTPSTLNPVPQISAVDPTFIPVTATDTQIAITGSELVPSTSAAIGAQGISTTYVSATKLTAVIPASYLAAPGTLQIGVYTPAPGGGLSATTVPITVGTPNPVPTLASVGPSSVEAGSGAFTLTLTGSGFVAGGQAFLGTTALATTVSSATEAQASVPASLVATAGERSVIFVNPTPGGGASSALTFTVTSPDAGQPPTCFHTPVVAPTVRPPATTFLPPLSFGCTQLGVDVAVNVFEITQPTYFTMFHDHSLVMRQPIELRAGCDASATTLLGPASNDCHIRTRLLDPGLYTFVSCDNMGSFITERAPVAADDNTSCAKATPLPRTFGNRVFDSGARYFSAQGGFTRIDVTSVPTPATMRAGYYRLRVETACDGTGTTVFDSSTYGGAPGNACFNGDTRPYTFPQTDPTKVYYVTISDIEPGLKLRIETGF